MDSGEFLSIAGNIAKAPPRKRKKRIAKKLKRRGGLLRTKCPKLLDGQHRLAAVVELSRPVWMLAVATDRLEPFRPRLSGENEP